MGWECLWAGGVLGLGEQMGWESICAGGVFGLGFLVGWRCSRAGGAYGLVVLMGWGRWWAGRAYGLGVLMGWGTLGLGVRSPENLTKKARWFQNRVLKHFRTAAVPLSPLGFDSPSKPRGSDQKGQMVSK